MYKYTSIYYPHIVKQYETVEQFLTENGYAEYYAAKHAELSAMGIDINNASVYREDLSEDGFEGKVTIVFDSEEHFLSAIDQFDGTEYTMKRPIFEEKFRGDSSEHLI